MKHARTAAIRTVLAACIALALLVACSHTVRVYSYKYDSALDHVFVKKDTDFSRYRAIIIDDPSVWHPTEDGPTPERAAQIRANLARERELFRETLSAALADRYEIRTEPVRATLRLSVEFIDLRALPPGHELPGRLQQAAFRSEPGRITMLARLTDAHSGVLLARAADLGKQAVAAGQAPVDWEAIASDYDYWAQVFRAWLDRQQSR